MPTSVAEPADPEPASAREITARPPRRLTPGTTRQLSLAAMAVALFLIGSLVVATVQDGDGLYPGSRSGPAAHAPGAVLTLPGSLVDDFEHPVDTGLGPYPGLGRWQTANGTWTVLDGLAVATPDPQQRAVAFITAPHAELLFQVDLFQAQPGSGLVFRYRDQRNYWAVQELASGRWNVLRVLDGTVRESHRFTVAPNPLRTIGVWLDDSEVQISVSGIQVLSFHDSTLSTEQKVGLLSSSPSTMFDNASLYDG